MHTREFRGLILAKPTVTHYNAIMIDIAHIHLGGKHAALLFLAFQMALSTYGKEWPALADGQPDASGIIQAAVNSGNGDIHFPKGVYRLKKTVVIDLARTGVTSISGNGTARIIMAGEGPAFRFIGTHTGTANPASFDDNVWERQRMPLIDGIEIVGAHPQASGIEAEGTMQLTISRVLIRKALHGIRLTGRNRNVTISDCHIYHNRGVGIFLDHVNLHQINVSNNHISYNAMGGIVVRGTELRNLQIGTCDIEGNMGDTDSTPSANIEIDRSGINGGEIAITGCTIQHSHEAPGSTNILIKGESTKRAFSSETRDGNITITGNVLSDTQVNIDISDARGVTLTGNTLWKGYAHNLVVRRCENIVVSNNVFDRNPRYHYGDGADAKLAILFEQCDGLVFQGNLVRGLGDSPVAVTMRDSRHVNMTGCNILDFGSTGILWEGVSYGLLANCIIRETRSEHLAAANPIRIIGGTDNRISENILSPSE